MQIDPANYGYERYHRVLSLVKQVLWKRLAPKHVVRKMLVFHALKRRLMGIANRDEVAPLLVRPLASLHRLLKE